MMIGTAGALDVNVTEAASGIDISQLNNAIPLGHNTANFLPSKLCRLCDHFNHFDEEVYCCLSI
jgi:hypothetical protein